MNACLSDGVLIQINSWLMSHADSFLTVVEGGLLQIAAQREQDRAFWLPSRGSAYYTLVGFSGPSSCNFPTVIRMANTIILVVND